MTPDRVIPKSVSLKFNGVAPLDLIIDGLMLLMDEINDVDKEAQIRDLLIDARNARSRMKGWRS